MTNGSRHSTQVRCQLTEGGSSLSTATLQRAEHYPLAHLMPSCPGSGSHSGPADKTKCGPIGLIFIHHHRSTTPN